MAKQTSKIQQKKEKECDKETEKYQHVFLKSHIFNIYKKNKNNKENTLKKCLNNAKMPLKKILKMMQKL